MKLDYIHDEISSKKSQVVLRLVDINVDNYENCTVEFEKKKLQQKNTSVEHKSHEVHRSSESKERDDEGTKDELLNDPPSIATITNRIKLTKDEIDTDEDEYEMCCCGWCCGCVKKLCRRKKKKKKKEKKDRKEGKKQTAENVIENER